MDDRAAALDMAEEAVAEAVAVVRAFDQAGNVGEHEIAVVDFHDAEAGMQGGERIVGDLRAARPRRSRAASTCRRSAGRRVPTSAISFSRRISVRSMPGWPGLARRGARLVEVVKCSVAEPAVAALGDHGAIAFVLEVGDQRAGLFVEHLRAGGDFQHGVGAAAAGAVLAHAVHAGLGLEVLLVAEIDQGVEAVGAFDDDVAAAPAVAAVGAAELDEFLAPERDAAGAAVAGADVDLGLIKKFHRAVSDISLAATAVCRAPRRPVRALRSCKRSHGTRPPRAGAPCGPVTDMHEARLFEHAARGAHSRHARRR